MKKILKALGWTLIEGVIMVCIFKILDAIFHTQTETSFMVIYFFVILFWNIGETIITRKHHG